MDDQNCAFQMPIEEAELRAYLQRYPYATGPDEMLNERGRRAIVERLAIRTAAASPKIRTGADATRWLSTPETALPADALARVQQLLDQVGVPAAERAFILDDFGWEANLAPRTAKDVLVIGCGNGYELLFLRAVLPDARLTAIDYSDSMSPRLKQAVGVRFFQGDMNTILDELKESFDLVSSNHTLEHLYTPDMVLAMLAGVLRPEGALISTLPMDGMADTPFRDKVLEAARSRRVNRLDMVYLDSGHPWKTNPVDLQATLLGAGFAKVELYQRTDQPGRWSVGRAEWERKKRLGLRLHGLFLGAPRAVAKAVFGERVPGVVVKAIQVVENRVWFGGNRLKNSFTEETCMVASRSA